MSVNFNAANTEAGAELDKRPRPQEIEINGYVTTLAVSDYDVARLGYKVAGAPANKAVVVVDTKSKPAVDLTEGEDTAAHTEEDTEDDVTDTDAPVVVPTPRTRRRG